MMAVRRLYQLGEANFARGDHEGAVALWRQTFLLLPRTAEGDRLRHALVQRLGFGLLSAYATDLDPGHLEWGQRVMERYLAKHEELFGDDTAARKAREPIYELLGDIELRLDEELNPGVGLSDVVVAVHDEVENAFDEIQRDDDWHTGEVLDDDGMTREVVVKDSPFATGEEERVKAYLHDDRYMGPSMFDDDGEPLNLTRPLVRRGIIMAGRGAAAKDRRASHKYVAQLVKENRPALEQCYEELLTRAPVLAAKVKLTVSLDENGELAGLRVAEGHLGDAHGDACVYWAIARADGQAKPPQLTSAVDLELPITFFVQPERHISDTRWKGAPSAAGGSSMGDATFEFKQAREANMQNMGAARGRRGN